MNSRKINIGIIQTYILIIIHVLFALTFLIDFMADNYDEKKDIIYQASYAYMYVSVVYLIRRIVLENSVIVKYLSWIIRLEILKALCSILVSTGIYQARILESIFGLILLAIYITLIINVLNKKYNERNEIVGLRPFVIAVIFGYIISLIGGTYAEFNGGFEIYGIIYLIITIPYVFIIRYLITMKKETNALPTANTRYN